MTTIDTTGIMREYKRELKDFSRALRNEMTPAEIIIWARLRGNQILGVRFYRQKPLLKYIVDFYCHQAKLVIECDGSQHFEDEHAQRDEDRDYTLNQNGMLVLRFDNSEIVQKTDAVMEVILDVVGRRINPPISIPPSL